MTSRRTSSDGAGWIILAAILIVFYIVAYIYCLVNFWTNYQDDDTHDMTFYGIVLVMLTCGGSSRARS